MTCPKVMKIIYEDEPVQLLDQLLIWAHVFLCRECANKIERMEETKNILRDDFFPVSPELEESIMARITVLENEERENTFDNRMCANPGELSTRGWVIAGLVILISLVTAYFGFDFRSLASELGASFVLPVGITVGIVVTSYGALFIGSHLKELSERFGL